MKKIKYNVKKRTNKSLDLFNSVPGKQHYSGSFYGLDSQLTGNGINITVVDTGTPKHPDITNIRDAIDASGKASGHNDKHGHSTMVAGIIGSNNSKQIVGVSPGATLSFAKVMNGIGDCTFESLITAMLWAIVKKTDIILISLGSRNNYSVLHDAVKKAYDCGIVVIAANENTKEVNYPANYPECLSVSLGKRKFRKKNTISITLPNDPIYTTYLNGIYTKISGSSVAAAVTAGLAALLVEKCKKEKRAIAPDHIYKQLSSLRQGPG